MPNTVPVPFNISDVLEQALPAHPIGIHFKAVTVATVQIGIEDHGKQIVTLQALSLAQNVGRHQAHVRLFKKTGNIERFFRIENPHLGLLGGLGVFGGFVLVKVLNQHCLSPDHLIQHAIDAGQSFEFGDDDCLRTIAVALSILGCC